MSDCGSIRTVPLLYCHACRMEALFLILGIKSCKYHEHDGGLLDVNTRWLDSNAKDYHEVVSLQWPQCPLNLQ